MSRWTITLQIFIDFFFSRVTLHISRSAALIPLPHRVIRTPEDFPGLTLETWLGSQIYFTPGHDSVFSPVACCMCFGLILRFLTRLVFRLWTWLGLCFCVILCCLCVLELSFCFGQVAAANYLLMASHHHTWATIPSALRVFSTWPGRAPHLTLLASVCLWLSVSPLHFIFRHFLGLYSPVITDSDKHDYSYLTTLQMACRFKPLLCN